MFNVDEEKNVGISVAGDWWLNLSKEFKQTN